jgi:hypothetical protein
MEKDGYLWMFVGDRIFVYLDGDCLVMTRDKSAQLTLILGGNALVKRMKDNFALKYRLEEKLKTFEEK